MTTPSYQLDDLEILKEARELWSEGKTDVALQRFAEATHANPRNVRAHVERAAALGKRYRMQEACELLHAAREMAGDNLLVASQVARCYANMYRVPQAIECLEAVPDHSERPLGLAELAVFYEQVGRFDDAEEAIIRCIDAASEQPEPRLILARILTHQGKPDAAHTVLINLVEESSSRQPLLTVRALYQLALLFDAGGNYDDALSAASQAKAIQKKFPQAAQLARSATATNARWAKIYERLDVETLDRWAAENLPPLPGNVRAAHLLGFPRSGTTLLEQPLDAHPNLIVSSERLVFAEAILPALLSPRRAADDFAALDGLSHEQLCELRERYIQFLQATHSDGFSGKVHLDKKPANLAFLFGLARLLPESKYVVAIRDPRDVMVSCFLRYFPLTDLSACFLSWGSTCMIYKQVMEVWLYMRELMQSESKLEVRYEDVCDDLVGQAARVFEFLNLDHDPNVADYLQSTRHKYVHSPTFAEVRKPVHRRSVGRWKHYETQLEPFLDSLQPFVEAHGYS